MKHNSTKRFLALLLAFVMIATSGIMTAGFSLLANETDNTADTQVVQEVSTGEDAEAAEAVTDKSAEAAEAAEEAGTDAAAAEETATDETADDAAAEEATEAKAADTDKAADMPAQKFTEKAGDVTVKVTADKGAFPEGTTMQVVLLTDEDALEAANKGVADGEKIVDAVAVNITFENAEGDEIEPVEDGLVTVKIDAGRKLDGDSFDVTHITDEGKAEDVDVTKVNAKGATFDADAFSVYVVSGSDAVVRTVKFYESKNAMDNGENPIDTQVAGNGEEITEPDVPDVGENTNKKFKGWSADGESFYTFGEVTGLTGDETVSLYPVYTQAKQQQIIYWDFMKVFSADKNMIVWTDKADVGDSYTPLQDVAENEVDCLYPNSQACIGWTTSWTDSLASALGTMEVEPLESIEIVADKDVNLYPVMRPAHWIVYETNGGSNIDPDYYLNGKTTVAPEDPTKDGYVFEGWYKTMTTDEETGEVTFSDKFEFGDTLDNLPANEKLTLYAKWNAVETVYTVLYWKASLVNGKYVEDNYGNSYIATERGTAVSGTSIDELITDAMKTKNETDSESYNSNFDFYHYDKYDSTDTKVEGDGSTIINVYYDINEYTMYFTYYRWATLTDPDGNTYKNEGSNQRVSGCSNDEVSLEDAYSIKIHYNEKIDFWPTDADFSDKQTTYVNKNGYTANIKESTLYGWSYEDLVDEEGKIIKGGGWSKSLPRLKKSVFTYGNNINKKANGSTLIMRGYWLESKYENYTTTNFLTQNVDNDDPTNLEGYTLHDTNTTLTTEGNTSVTGQTITGFTYNKTMSTSFDQKYVFKLVWDESKSYNDYRNTDAEGYTNNSKSVSGKGKYKIVELTKEESDSLAESKPDVDIVIPFEEHAGYIGRSYKNNYQGAYNSSSVKYKTNNDKYNSILDLVVTYQGKDTLYMTAEVLSEVNLYYTRNKYTIDFYNVLGYSTEEGYEADATEKQLIKTTDNVEYETNEDGEKVEVSREKTVPYQKSLADYWFEPTTNRKNVTFEGWYYNEEFTGAKVTKETFEKGTMPAGDLVLYAKWSDSTIDITFDYKSDQEADEFEIKPGSTISEDQLKEPEKDGFTFLGWFTKDEETGKLTDPYSFDTKLYKDTEVYAKWRFNGDIKLAYDLDGGEWAGEDSDLEAYGDDYVEKDMTYKDGETARTSDVKLKKDGYVFYGWKINGEGNIIRPNQIFDIDSSDAEEETQTFTDADGNEKEYGVLRLVAVYGPDNGGSGIYFDANGGSGKYSKSLAKNERYELTDAETIGITRTGYTFQKWNDDAEGSGTAYSAGDKIYVNGEASDNVLYAQWKANTYTASVKYQDSDGKTLKDSETLSYTVEDDGKTITIPSFKGYTPSKVIVNGEEIAVDSKTGKITIADGKMPASDLDITVVYSKETKKAAETTETTDDDDDNDDDDNTAAATTTVARGGGGGAAAAVAAAAAVPAGTAVAVTVDDDGDVTLTQVPDTETPAALLEDTEACNLIPFLFMAIAMVVEAFNNKNSKNHKRRMEDLLG